MTTKISGKVIKIRFTKEDFHICTVSTNTGDHTVKLNHNNLKVGFIGDFTGIWVDDEKWGGQFKCYFAIEKLPQTKEGFKQYLMSKTFKGIGEKTADKIIQHLGENPVGALSKDPDMVLKTPGVKMDLLEQIKKVYLDNTVRAEITIFLQQYGISPNLINKIYDTFGLNTIPQLTKNAYILINRIDGVGFKIADRIAIKMGIDPKSELRITECIKFVLKEAGNIGYCYLLRPQIHKKVQELIERIDIELIDSCIVESQDIIKLEINDEERFYSRTYYNAEQRCLNSLINMLEQPPVGFMDNVAQEETLSPEQKNAVYGALSNNVSILTGGPGCGKTYTTKTIVESLLNAKKTVGICAPTGKAALRSSTVIGHEAMTIHRILGFNPRLEGSFEYTSDNPLPYDFVIVEESSMIDIKLMANLLDAVGYGTQILFVGDHNQLPPVGAGAPFKDMIESGLTPTFKLNKIFRQGDDSRLVHFAHQINNAEYPHIDSPIKNPGLWATKTDCLFIDSGFSDGRKRSEYDKTNTLHFGMDVAETIVRLYTETIKRYRNYNDIQILVPKRVGTIGTNVINAMIQDVVNPITAVSKVIAIGERTFRLNDKVIHVQNNYNLGEDGIFNGEIGKIIDITDKGCTIDFDGKEVVYKRSDMIDLELAFAISIHKSQGSEFECVILPLMMEYGMMLEKSLIYTGLTRAKKLALFVGQRQALMRSIHNTNQSKRQTSLSELLIENKNLVE